MAIDFWFSYFYSIYKCELACSFVFKIENGFCKAIQGWLYNLNEEGTNYYKICLMKKNISISMSNLQKKIKKNRQVFAELAKQEKNTIKCIIQ